MDIRDYRGAGYGNGFDLSDTIIHTCPCGSDLFRLVVSFDNYEIAAYSTDMECIECGTRAKAPTPIDHPEYQGE